MIVLVAVLMIRHQRNLRLFHLAVVELIFEFVVVSGCSNTGEQSFNVLWGTQIRLWEKSLVGRKIYCLDEDDTGRWEAAAIVAYNSWKNKWKIVWANKDGDYFWCNLRKEHARVMMRMNDPDTGEEDPLGNWIMLKTLFPGRREEHEL